MTASPDIMTTYGPTPVTFVSGSGTELVDEAGKTYLDFLAGLAVVSLGHARPEVTEAVASQAATLTHVSNLFGNDQGPQVARLLAELLEDATGHHGSVFFCNSGAEANECALKLARRWAGDRYAVIALTDSFHGRTMATLAATGQPEKQAAFLPMPERFVHVAIDDAATVRDLLGTGQFAAVIVEGIQAEGGIKVPAEGYLTEIATACREAGALLIFDEVQTGLGRTGDWFSFQHEGVVPDIVTMAKALGNGFPVGACWARDEVAASYQPGDHGSTFGGQPLAMAAAKATLSTLIAIDAPAAASSASAQLRAGLLDLPGVIDVRGRGLLLGAVLEAPAAREVVQAALGEGLVANAVRPDVVRLTPPLTVTPAEITEALHRLRTALTKTMGVKP
jgi:predicted acetylornithine/succinylornithine family transaminase